MFSGVFRADLKRPGYANNDRLIFSKGHAAPLLYAIYAAAGAFPMKELLTLRTLKSRLEGHPSPRFPYTEIPTGSLGQGLSTALGEAIAANMDKLPYRVYCLLGDSEMAEGSVWEAIQLAGFRKQANLVGILDLNGLGQTGPTMLGHDAGAMAKRVAAFGWKTIIVDGHDLAAITQAYVEAAKIKDAPVMIIARTVKGKGVPLIEGKDGWHGKVLDKTQATEALKAIGRVDDKLRGRVELPLKKTPLVIKKKPAKELKYKLGAMVATREALGMGLVRLASAYPSLTVLDGEIKNSCYTENFGRKNPKRFVEGYIAEQNLVGMSLGLAKCGQRPVFATFAAFMTRAFDQLRMASYAKLPLVMIGTHAGVSIGQDGPSQMGLQDIAMFRTLENSAVLYPADAVAAEKLLEKTLRYDGIAYIRATRGAAPVIYNNSARFVLGGSNVLRKSKEDKLTIVAAGVTLFESLKAADALAKKKVMVRVIDLYSIKPIDAATLKTAGRETKKLIVVEDGYPEGGIAEAVRTALDKDAGAVISLAARKTPRSGKPEELLAYEGIDAAAIQAAIMKALK
jgi:transketolase